VEQRLQGALLTSDALKTPLMIRAGGPASASPAAPAGAVPKRYLDHHRRAFGPGGDGANIITSSPFPTGSSPRTPPRGGHCEISAFAHSGIALRRGEGHLIHHNFIHHCQYNGLGYGVSHDVAASLIECNLFNWNRHSIAGTGRPGCSYVARNNVELGESLSHCFDMHGGRDREDGTDIAGTTIEIYNNTFGAPQPAIVIRGVPQDKCDAHHNWFIGNTQPDKACAARKRPGRTTTPGARKRRSDSRNIKSSSYLLILILILIS